MLTITYGVLQKAYEGHYAVPVISTQGGTYGVMRAVRMAVGELRSPVILARYVSTGVYLGHDWFYETTKRMASKVSASVVIHLDHEDSFERYMEMLKLGFTSITLNGSALPVEENAAAAEAVTRVCRSSGVLLEAEIGGLYRLDDRGNEIGASNIADPSAMRQYLKLCHPDSLAIGAGDAHGFYSGPVDIRVEVLEEYRKFTDIPFVLHGCAGIDEESVKRSADSGVAGINLGTQVRCQYVNYLREGLAEEKDQGHAWRLSQYVELRLREGIKDITRLAGPKKKA